jgi:hypothetical protein
MKSLEIHLKIAFLGDLNGIGHRFGRPFKQMLHGNRTFEIKLVIAQPHTLGVIKGSLGLDT